VGFVYDDDDQSLAVAQHWGYEIVSHGIESRLSAADLEPLGPVPSGLRLDYIPESDLTDAQIIALDDLITRAATHPEAVELGWHIGVADYRRMFPGNVWSLIWDSEQPVALSTSQPEADNPWPILFTAVDPSYRGRGLAKLVKQNLHIRAAAAGAETFITWNEERNVDVRKLNESLGYVKTGGEFRLKRPPRVADSDDATAEATSAEQ